MNIKDIYLGCSKELSHRNTSFGCLKHNFTIEGKQPKPRLGSSKGPSRRDGSLYLPSHMFSLKQKKVTSPKSTQRWTTNGPPTIGHLNGISLVGR